MDFDAARLNMVNGQLLTNRVTDDRLIEVLSSLPREQFLPDARRTLAYCDEDVEIGEGRFLMEPMVMAQLVQASQPRANEVALVVGCATGYVSAVYGRLVSAVVAVEENAKMAARASEVLSQLGIDNVAVIEGALAEGGAGQGPYDVIFVDGALSEVPAAYQEQLADGGRLVAVERDGRIGRGVIYTRNGDAVSRRAFVDAAVPIIPGFEAPLAFVF